MTHTSSDARKSLDSVIIRADTFLERLQFMMAQDELVEKDLSETPQYYELPEIHISISPELVRPDEMDTDAEASVPRQPIETSVGTNEMTPPKASHRPSRLVMLSLWALLITLSFALPAYLLSMYIHPQ